jgi:hypothetical protein
MMSVIGHTDEGVPPMDALMTPAELSEYLQKPIATLYAWLHRGEGPDLYEWSIAQVDPNGRPLLLPANSTAVLPIQAAANGAPPVGFTGERLAGTAVFTDGSIPNASTSSQTQILVCNAADVLTMTSEPVVRAFVESDALDLTVIIQLYALTGCIVRHGTSVQVISGAAYLSAPTFA